LKPLKKLVIKPTVKCYHKCKYCVPRQNYFAELVTKKNRDKNQLENMPLEMAIKCITDAHSLGMSECLFSGGDPLIYPDIVELVSKASSLDNVFVYLNSLGVGIQKSKVIEIIEAGLSAWNLSLDTIDPKTYDKLRGLNGAFKNAMETLDVLKDARKTLNKKRQFFINYMTVITRYNYQSLPRLLENAIANQISSIYFIFIQGDSSNAFLLSKAEIIDFRRHIVPKMLEILYRAELPDPVFANAQKVLTSFYCSDNSDDNYSKNVWWTNIEAAKNSCNIPDYCLHIEPDGTVLPCCVVEISHEGEVGNLWSSTLKDIWDSKALQEFRSNKMTFCIQCPVQRNKTLGLIPEMCRQF